jgi:hypothetical protein
MFSLVQRTAHHPPVQIVILLGLSLLLAFPRAAHGQGSGPDTLYYVLSDASSFNVGCYGPCDCAVRSTPLRGTFRLRKTDVNPMFTTYAVENFRAAFPEPAGVIDVSGSGDYRIGGEVAITQQLRLDLVIGGRPPQAFDSGVVSGGYDFPAISIEAAAHGFACYDTVVQVVAKPGTAGLPGPPRAEDLLGVTPNPFRGSAEVVFQLRGTGRADVSVLDAQGRLVAWLSRGAEWSAIPHTLRWDGRARDGRAARAGIYWIRVESASGTTQRRVAKLD